MINCFAFIAQNSGKKYKTAFIIIGEFGSGKNTLTDTFIKLFKRYSKNFQRVDSAVDKFNSVVENTIFGVFNELVSVDNKNFYNFDAMKELETGERFVINENNVPEREAANVIHNIYLSNHRVPFKINENDRR
jgi:hypothetical protein